MAVVLKGFIWHEIKLIIIEGLNEYLQSWKNILNSTMNIIYLTSFFLKYYTMVEVHIAKEKVKSQLYWTNLIYSNVSVGQERDLFSTLYWLNADRYFWIEMDPINISEGLFAVANLLSFLRICFYLPANQQLGPLQISLGNMLSDVSKFLVILFIFFTSFMISLNNLFWYYQTSVRRLVELDNEQFSSNNKHINTTTTAEEKFGSISVTFKTMFWALFGYGTENDTDLSPIFKNNVTETFGFIIYGFFHATIIIILLNMLIASMTQSYEKILLESDCEWKFARSKLYMEYIRENSTLPVPFNLIPTPNDFIFLFRKIKQMICKRSNDELEESPSQSRLNRYRMNEKPDHITRKPSTININDELTYIKVMQRIVKRFLLHKQRETDEVGEADFEELKQDLQMVRYEMINDLKRYREENYRLISHIHNGILLLGEELYKDSSNKGKQRFEEYKDSEKFDVFDILNEDEIKLELKSQSMYNRFIPDNSKFSTKNLKNEIIDNDLDDASNISRIMQATDYTEYSKINKSIRATSTLSKDLSIIAEDDE